MSIKQEIIHEFRLLSPENNILVSEYLQSLNKNRKSLSEYAWKNSIGVLNDSDCEQIKKIIETEFENIEGDW